jgi:uncharacterized membrane protein (UPF0127 family)
MQLIEKSSGRVLLEDLRQAKTFLQKFRGMMLRRKCGVGSGLWLESCGSIHTMWMRFPIDVYFIDQQGRILEIRSGVTPWSIVIPKQRCHAVLEIPHGNPMFEVGMVVAVRE